MKKVYRVDMTIGLEFEFEGDSPEDVENYLREEMSQEEYRLLILHYIDEAECTIECTEIEP